MTAVHARGRCGGGRPGTAQLPSPALPVFPLTVLMLGALGLVLSIPVRQLENFAGTMDFVIFPMFFLSTALHPAWKLQQSDGALALTAGGALPFFGLAPCGCDPQRGTASEPGAA